MNIATLMESIESDLAEEAGVEETLRNRLIERLIKNSPRSGLFEFGMALGWLGEAEKFATANNHQAVANAATAMLKAAKLKMLAKALGID